MSDNTLVQEENATQAEVTPNTEIEAQEESKSYSQKEVDDMMARMKGSLNRKFENKYADLGDVDELRSLKAEAEKRQQEFLSEYSPQRLPEEMKSSKVYLSRIESVSNEDTINIQIG